jgi:hypothetical protein
MQRKVWDEPLHTPIKIPCCCGAWNCGSAPLFLTVNLLWGLKSNGVAPFKERKPRPQDRTEGIANHLAQTGNASRGDKS